jgi:hypothetical protein
LLDIRKPDDRTIGSNNVADGIGGLLGRQGSPKHAMLGKQSKNNPLDHSGIGSTLLRNPVENLGVDAQRVLSAHAGKQDSPGLGVHRLDRAIHTTVETRMEIMPEGFQLVESTVRYQNDLARLSQEHVDGVSQLDQCACFAQTKLNVVDHQDLDISILFSETGKATGFGILGVFNRELLAGQKHNSFETMLCFKPLRESHCQMGLTYTVRTVNEHRTDLPRTFQDHAASSPSKLIVRTYNELIPSSFLLPTHGHQTIDLTIRRTFGSSGQDRIRSNQPQRPSHERILG